MLRSPLAYLVQTHSGTISSSLQHVELPALAPGNVRIRVRYSSLNYKDAMAAVGHPGITKQFPHVPGIDAAGVVEESLDPRYRKGDLVLATGHDLGVKRFGGWCQEILVPADWVQPLPAGLTLEEAMTIGTAGFTAAQSVQALIHQGIQPDSGPVVVTGATGGVATISINLLSQLGYEVLAVTGKLQHTDWLKSIGAREVLGRERLTGDDARPLLSSKYAGGIDTVGGLMLANLCKMTMYRGAIACCGLTAGTDLPLTVYPFILRGLALCGIDSAWCPDELRPELWRKLANEWKPSALSSLKRVVTLQTLEHEVTSMLNGTCHGRVVVQID